jgi:hypothetical protein
LTYFIQPFSIQVWNDFELPNRGLGTAELLPRSADSAPPESKSADAQQGGWPIMVLFHDFPVGKLVNYQSVCGICFFESCLMGQS